MSEIETIITSLLPSLIVSIVMAYWEKRQTDRQKKQEAKQKAQDEAQRVQLDILLATAKLSYASAMAIKRGHANGEVEAATEGYNEAIKNYEDYERQLMTKIS